MHRVRLLDSAFESVQRGAKSFAFEYGFSRGQEFTVKDVVKTAMGTQVLIEDEEGTLIGPIDLRRFEVCE